MMQLVVKQSLMLHDHQEDVAEVEKEITGVAVSNERGQDEMTIQLLQESDELGRLIMDLETARMIRTALNTMKVLDRGEEQT